ncbi:MAG: copper chaperone PCu(A)C [Burkholderiales bacterium]|nr:copper chaperone PCu(A)C [Burkholderiales bacterium]
MSSKLPLMGLLFALFAAPAWGQVTVADAWIRGTVPGQMATGAFMQLTSSTDTALVGVASPAAKVAEIHEMAMAGGVMKMRAIDKLALPAGKAVELQPGGYHLMLMQLVQPLKAGDSVPLTLTFADREGRKTTKEIKVPVRALTTPAMPRH